MDMDVGMDGRLAASGEAAAAVAGMHDSSRAGEGKEQDRDHRREKERERDSRYEGMGRGEMEETGGQRCSRDGVGEVRGGGAQKASSRIRTTAMKRSGNGTVDECGAGERQGGRKRVPGLQQRLGRNGKG